MARKRMIDPTIWADEDFGQLSEKAQVMFMGMISNADDEGRLPGNSLYLASTIFPYKGLSEKQAEKVRGEVLERMKSVKLYVVDSKEYIQFINWQKYQSINKPSESKYPPMQDHYRSDTVALPPNRIEKNRKEKNRSELKSDLQPAAAVIENSDPFKTIRSKHSFLAKSEAKNES